MNQDSRFLTQLPFVDVRTLIGVNHLFSEIHTTIHSKSRFKSNITNIYSDVAGRGATSLAVAYLQTPEYGNQYETIIWVALQSDFKQSLIATLLQSTLGATLIKHQNIDSAYNFTLDHLSKSTGNNLIVFDNCEKPHQQEIKAFEKQLKWKILTISNSEISSFRNIFVEPFDHQSAALLFYQHKKGVEEMLEVLMKAVEYHPILIILCAKNLTAHPDLDTVTLFKLFVDQNRRTPHLKDVMFKNLSQIQERRLRKVMKYVLAILENRLLTFDLSARKYLRWFSLIPPGAYSFDELCETFGIKNEKNKLSDVLLDLFTCGWIQLIENRFVFHPIILSVWQKKFKPDAQNCKQIIENTNKLLQSHARNEYLKSLNYWQFAKNCIERCTKSDQSESIADLANSLGVVMQETGDYEAALNFYEQSIEIRENILVHTLMDEAKVPSLNLATSYDNNASNLRKLGKLDESLEFAQKALQLRHDNLPENHPMIAATYMKIAIIFHELRKFEKAIEFIDNALDIYKEIYPANHIELQQALTVQEQISIDFDEWETKFI